LIPHGIVGVQVSAEWKEPMDGGIERLVPAGVVLKRSSSGNDGGVSAEFEAASSNREASAAQRSETKQDEDSPTARSSV
jgi:hypothetical protein